MMRLGWRVGLLAIASSICSLQVKAGPITYLTTITATGTLGGQSFTDASMTVALTGDTSAVASGVDGISLLNPGTATVIIPGLGTATFTDSMAAASTFNTLFDGGYGAGIFDSTQGALVSFVEGFQYNLATAFTFSGTGGLGNGGGPGNIFPTTAGNLEFATGQSLGASTFAAIPTQSLAGYQGGTTSAPVYLVGGAAIGNLTGAISGLGAEDYYWFYWGGGAFAASATITGASGGASYIYSAGAAGACNSVGNETLNSGDGFSDTISAASLPAGQYCIGLDANSANDPNFSLVFNTPVNGVPEPSTFLLLSVGLAVVAATRRRAR